MNEPLLWYISTALVIRFIIEGVVITSIKSHLIDKAIRHYVDIKAFFFTFFY